MSNKFNKRMMATLSAKEVRKIAEKCGCKYPKKKASNKYGKGNRAKRKAWLQNKILAYETQLKELE